MTVQDLGLFQQRAEGVGGLGDGPEGLLPGGHTPGIQQILQGGQEGVGGPSLVGDAEMTENLQQGFAREEGLLPGAGPVPVGQQDLPLVEGVGRQGEGDGLGAGGLTVLLGNGPVPPPCRDGGGLGPGESGVPFGVQLLGQGLVGGLGAGASAEGKVPGRI